MFKSNKKNILGQTLIETMAGLFVLIMGVSSAVSLAVFAFGTSNAVLKQIVGTGLAREGLEAVRNMRDTNWLNDTLAVNSCYNYATSQNNAASCYVNWLGDSNLNIVPFCINPTSNAGNCNGSSSSEVYYLTQDSSSANYWNLVKTTNDVNGKFGLTFNNPDLNNNWGQYGFYDATASGSTCLSSNSGFCRTIILTKLTTAPYDKDNNLKLLQVRSQVWWSDKKCPKSATFDTAAPACKIELDSYLTNWKF